MGGERVGLWSALAWLVFPLAPTLLGVTYYQVYTKVFIAAVPDPRGWDWFAWIVLTGPLLGYGFLAGATLELSDTAPAPPRRLFRGWFSRRSVWVGVGPWIGFLCWVSAFFTLVYTDRAVHWAYPGAGPWGLGPFPSQEAWAGWLVVRALLVGLVGSVAYGWLAFAEAARRRARRVGVTRRALARGMAVAFGFVGSLIGSFWAVTEVWRGYFFDPRVVPVVLIAAGLAVTAGCGRTETYGDVRRRELFEAMLTAWLLGLALLWRWWSRPRPGPPTF